MKIGDLARRFNVPVETIRYYERENLLPLPDRTASNYRVYGPAHADRLRFIVNCRALDMTLDEIRSLLAYHDRPTEDCGEVTWLLDEHIGHVADRITELRRLETQLRALRSACRHGKSSGDCGILRSLREEPSMRRGRGDVHARGKGI
jgi:Cd(II)/Pb(II)-responsive transcriptional regulator